MENLYNQNWSEKQSALNKRRDLTKIFDKMDLPFATYYFDSWISGYDIDVYVQPKGKKSFTSAQGRKVRKVLNETLILSKTKWEKHLDENGVMWTKTIKDFWVEVPQVLTIHISFEPLPKTCHLVTKTETKEITTTEVVCD